MDPELLRLEQRHWSSDSLTARGTTLAELCEAVLEIGRQSADWTPGDPEIRTL